MAVKPPVVVPKQKRQVSMRRKASLRPAVFIPEKLTYAKIDASGESIATFDPRVLLTRLSAGKTSQEYQADETVFSQGYPADAVFYLQSGKVKLTVVSKRGKEAVVAILPQDSFFGEGCLAGQPLRMATASAEQRCTIIRVDKQRMLELLHRDPEGSGSGRSPIQLQRETPRSPSSADGQLRPGIQTRASHREDESGNPRRDDWHNPLASQLFP